MSEGIDPKILAEALETWTKGELECRARQQHPWSAYTCFANARTIDVHERCPRCKGRRHRLMNAKTGEWIDPSWRSVSFSPDYLFPKGSGRLSAKQKAQIRLHEIKTRKMVPE